MATLLKEVWIDDMDGTEAERTLRFSVGGRDYELDVSHENYRRFMDSIDPYVKAARRVPKSRKRKS